jgi:hypothetical protein
MGGSNLLSPAQGAPAQPTESVLKSGPASEVSFSLRGLSPPSNLYVTKNDFLILNIFDFAAGHTVFLDWQIMLPNGTLQLNEEQKITVALPSANSIVIDLPEGYLIRVGVRTNAANLPRGSLFATVAIIRSPLTTPIKTIIAQGFVSSFNNVAWPNGLQEASTSGQGRLVTHTVSNPAAGADFSYSAAVLSRASLLGIVATLTTGAAVANRLVQGVIDDGVNISVLAPAVAVQAASLAIQYVFLPGMSPQAPVGGDQIVGLGSGAKMGTNWRFRTLTQNIQAADQWSAISLGAEEWM